MSLTSLSCPPPVRRLTRDHKPDFALFEEAIELHDQGHHRASVERVFDHLFSREHPGRITDGITFEQGSSLVEVRLTEGRVLRVTTFPDGLLVVPDLAAGVADVEVVPSPPLDTERD